MLIMHQ